MSKPFLSQISDEDLRRIVDGLDRHQLRLLVEAAESACHCCDCGGSPEDEHDSPRQVAEFMGFDPTGWWS